MKNSLLLCLFLVAAPLPGSTIMPYWKLTLEQKTGPSQSLLTGTTSSGQQAAVTRTLRGRELNNRTAGARAVGVGALRRVFAAAGLGR